jgi:hypothetical protein
MRVVRAVTGGAEHQDGAEERELRMDVPPTRPFVPPMLITSVLKYTRRGRERRADRCKRTRSPAHAYLEALLLKDLAMREDAAARIAERPTRPTETNAQSLSRRRLMRRR